MVSGVAPCPNVDYVLTASFICTTDPCAGVTVVTYGGEDYNTIGVGTQCWLQRNLNIGTKINHTIAQTNNSILEKYCYNNIVDSCSVYGGLYQWNEAMQYSVVPGAQGICPSGWHIPTISEWVILRDYLGGPTVAGGSMKEIGYRHWISPNVGATNSSGFTLLGAGLYFSVEAGYSWVRSSTELWSSTKISFNVSNTQFNWGDASFYYGTVDGEVSNAVSVRCIKD